MYEERLAVLRRTRGDEHRNTLWAMFDLANLRTDMGEPAAVRPLLEEALAGCRRVLNRLHGIARGSSRH